MVCADEMDTAYLDNLDEYINDEGRIVTYKWLSLTLGVHSNVAKQMLHHFVTQQRGDGGGSGLTLTYLLTGVVEEGDGDVKKVLKVVREAEVEAARAAMNTVSSLHVYSVQKSALPDIGLLYGADYDVTKQHLTSTSRHSGIRCSGAQVSPNIGRLQHLVKEEIPTPPQKTVPKTIEKKEDKKHDPKLGNTTTTNTTTATSATTAATKPTSQIASMFARQTKKLENSSSTAVKEEKAPAKAKNAGISAFFTKGPAQRSPDTSKSGIPTTGVKSESTPCPDESKESLPTEDAQPNPMGKDDSPVFGVEQKEDKEVKNGGTDAGNTKTAKSKTTSSASSSASRKKRKSKGKKDEPKTKRTRIMQLSDSESDEEEEEDRDEEEDERLLLLPSPPPPVRVNSDSEEEKEEKNQLSKRLEEEAKVGMRKKIVDETYMDEKGYFVTKKVMKLVPLTEEEIKQEELEEEERKKKEDRRIKEEEEKEKKRSPTVKSETSPSSSSEQKKKKKGGKEDNKKQANIMSFFTKK